MSFPEDGTTRTLYGTDNITIRELWRVECLGCGRLLGAFPDMPTNTIKNAMLCWCEHGGVKEIAPGVH